jgi:acyl-CoA synthetase (AMP-forming)/AMP-acid ligase II
MAAIQKERATIFPGVPTMYIGIINHPKVKEYDLKSVKACISGAAPLPMDVQVKFGEITGGRLVEGYGLTEAAPVTHCNPIYGERKAGLDRNLPCPDVEAKIVDYEKFVDKPVGEEGELWLQGSAGDEGLLAASLTRRPRRSRRTAGCAPATSPGWMMTATSTSSIGSRTSSSHPGLTLCRAKWKKCCSCILKCKRRWWPACRISTGARRSRLTSCSSPARRHPG